MKYFLKLNKRPLCPKHAFWKKCIILVMQPLLIQNPECWFESPCKRGKTLSVTYSFGAFSGKAKQENYFSYMGLREYWCCISPILQPALNSVESKKISCHSGFTRNWFMPIEKFRKFHFWSYQPTKIDFDFT